MNWTIGGVRVFVSKAGGGGKQIMPLLQPLAGGTVIQFFGYETTLKHFSGLIVGDTDLAALLAMKESTSSISITSPEGALGSYYVREVKYDRLPIVWQTIRTDLACESPVYNIDVDVIGA